MASLGTEQIIWRSTGATSVQNQCLANYIKVTCVSAAKMAFGLASVVALSLSVDRLSLNFYVAFSALLAVVYLVSLIDATGPRDVVSLAIPTLAILLLIAWQPDSPLVIVVSWVGHAFIAFFAGLTQRGGSLKQLGLWPLLLGINVTLGLLGAEQFLIIGVQYP